MTISAMAAHATHSVSDAAATLKSKKTRVQFSLPALNQQQNDDARKASAQGQVAPTSASSLLANGVSLVGNAAMLAGTTYATGGGNMLTGSLLSELSA